MYQWQFLPFGLKNALTKFQRVMDRVLVGLGFAKFYIDDIIVFSLTLEDHKHHMQEVFEKLKNHNLKFHPSKCFLKTCGILGSHDLSKWIGVTKGQG